MFEKLKVFILRNINLSLFEEKLTVFNEAKDATEVYIFVGASDYLVEKL